MNRKLGLILTIVLGLTLSACGSTKKDTGPVTESEPVAQQEDMSRNMYGTGLSAEELASLGIMGNPLDYKTVYFEYNSSAIDRRSEVIASAHAREVARRGGAKVGLAGHCDERGTRDYNLALGERRSKAVANLMSSVGVGGSTLQTSSYGEEQPVDPGHNEAAWKKNRRVEITY